jgi:hypothetical protein
VKGSLLLDAVLVLLPSLSLALLVTAHLVLVAALAVRTPRWRAPLAFVVPPLAPFWAAKEKLRRWPWIWLGALVAYAVTLTLASLG